MGYRGDDASRAWGDPRRQEPWGGNPSQEGHEVYEQGPRDGGYGNYGGYGSQDGYGSQGGYADQGGYEQDGYGQGGYGSGPGYGQSGGYGAQGGFDAQRGYESQGGYGGQAGGFPDNDWYGESRSGGFADTSMHTRPAIPEGYRPGDYDARPQHGGTPGGFPPARPALPPAAALESAAADRLTQTRQQRMLDDQRENSYPGYENVDDPDGYGPGGYAGQPGYDDYDDYANYEVPSPTTAQPAYNEPAPTTAQVAYNEPAPTSANPAYGDEGYDGYDAPGEFGVGGGYDSYADGFDGASTGDQAAFPIPDAAGSARGGARGKGKAGRKIGDIKGKVPVGKGGKSRRKLILGGSAVCLVAAVLAVYFLIFKPTGDEQNANSPIPAPGSNSGQAACVKQFGQFCHIEFRTDDPKPLTVSELFPPAVMDEKDHTSFTRIVTESDKTCSNALLGQALTDAVNSGKCSQVLRASYTAGSGSKEIMGTIGVVNLGTTNEAHNAGKNVGTSDFINPLASNSGVGANLGQSTGVMESQYKGHYLILTWAELANEATPTSSDDQKLMQFEKDLIADTANIALSQRMVSGQPGSGA